MASAPVPTLNDTAPPVNLLSQFAHSVPAIQTGQHTGQSAQTLQVDLSGVIPVIFTILFVVWAIYTFIVIYHWFRYRHKSWFAVPSIVVHLAMSGSIILYMISGLK